MEESDPVLKRLCSLILGINDERIDRHYKLAASLLSQEIAGNSSDNLESVTDRCKKYLVKEKRMEDVSRLSTLFNRLHKSSVLHNKSNLLQLFLCLGHDNPSRSSSRSEISSLSTTPLSTEIGANKGHSDEFFHLPSLHSSSFGSSSSGGAAQSSRPSSTQDDAMFSGQSSQVSSTIARLTALYKDNTSNELDHSHLLRPKLKSSKYSSTKLPMISNRDEVQIEISESTLMREMLYIFQGIEGKIIKIDSSKDCYKIDPKVSLSVSKKQLILKLAEVGWLYTQIKQFCDSHSHLNNQSSSRLPGSTSSGTMNVGLVNQSFVLAMREELNEYCRLVAFLEAEVHDTGGRDTPIEDGSSGLTLRQLMLWTLEPRSRLTTLVLLTRSARSLTGGALVSAIYKHIHHGDPTRVTVVRHALSLACTPLYRMLTRWLLHGTLEDPHEEFFISANPAVPDSKLWQDKYDIRWSMLPSFISKSQARKVLSTGKSLNFLRQVCHFRDPISGRDAIAKALQDTTVESLFTQEEDNKLNTVIELTFRETSNHVLEEIINEHKLIDHLRALKRYLLLEQGDFIHYLMEILLPELGKPATSLHPHNLSSLLETAIVASNAQYEEPDILKRLDVRLLETSAGESGWDVFSLDYHVDGPIGTVLTADCMNKYLMLFNSLWRAKHMELILNATWKQQAATSKLCRGVPELQSTLHGVQLLLTEMIHLVQQMAYYMTFEVLECSWEALMTCLKSARSLDDIIDAHNEFLKRIVAGALLDKNSEGVRAQLRTVYKLMVKLERLQENLYNTVVGELNARNAAELLIQENTKKGDFGTCSINEEREEARRREFTVNFVPKIKSQLLVLSQTYQDMLQSFLLVLAQHEDENLHLLSTRLDFNEHYHRKDHRLNQRLTYHHKRKSMSGREAKEIIS